jgi:hypothetical protein
VGRAPFEPVPRRHQLLVLFAAMLFVFKGIPATAPLFLLVLLPLVLFTLGFPGRSPASASTFATSRKRSA